MSRTLSIALAATLALTIFRVCHVPLFLPIGFCLFMCSFQDLGKGSLNVCPAMILSTLIFAALVFPLFSAFTSELFFFSHFIPFGYRSLSFLSMISYLVPLGSRWDLLLVDSRHTNVAVAFRRFFFRTRIGDPDDEMRWSFVPLSLQLVVCLEPWPTQFHWKVYNPLSYVLNSRFSIFLIRTQVSLPQVVTGSTQSFVLSFIGRMDLRTYFILPYAAHPKSIRQFISSSWFCFPMYI